MVSKEMKMKIALDLVNKYPKGPNGDFRRKHYEMHREYHWQFERYTDIPYLQEDIEYKKFFGYDPTVLFSFRLDNEYDARRLLRDAYEELDPSNTPSSSQAMSRRARLLYYRVHSAAEHVRRFGGQGIYRVTWYSGYGRDKYADAYVPAKTVADAEAVGDMLRGLYGVPLDVRTRAAYYDKAEPVATLGLNAGEATHLQERANRAVAKLEEQLLEAKARAEKAAMLASMIHQNAFSLAGVDEESANA